MRSKIELHRGNCFEERGKRDEMEKEMKTEIIEELKQAMGYVSETECCASCQNFRKATDGVMCGGPPQQPKGDGCALNVIEVPVDSAGRCNHFEKREPFARICKPND